jgi:hypothetical protein
LPLSAGASPSLVTPKHPYRREHGCGEPRPRRALGTPLTSSGTPTAVGDNLTTVTATDGTGASASAKFTIRVASPVRFAGPGAQASYIGQPVRLAVPASDAVAGRTLTYSAGPLPAGLSLDSATGVVTGLPARGYTAASVSAHDSAGRSSDDPFIWYVAPAQVSARTATIRLGRDCLDARAGVASVAACTGQPRSTGRSSSTAPSPGRPAASPRTARCRRAPARPRSNGGSRRSESWQIASGNCLTGSSTGGVGVAPCTGAVSQRWTAPPGPIVSAVTGTCADSAVQQWRVDPDATVVHQASGDCLTDPVDNAVVATRLVIEPCRSAAGQLWHIE